MSRIASIIVEGVPISVNGGSASRSTWKHKVTEAAQKEISNPLLDSNIKIRSTYFYKGILGIDVDNISKPICDALQEVVYADDRQISNRQVRCLKIDGLFRINGVPSNLAVALAKGENFVWIEVSKTEEEEEQNLNE